MKITDTSLRRPVSVLVLTMALVYFGIFAYNNMGMQQIPDVDLPLVMVTTTMQGATAAVMDNDVTDVIEEQINTISGIESLSSSSYQGVAVTVVEFDINRDIDAAAADVRDKVNAAQADLPDEADAPIIAKYDIGDSPVAMATIRGSASYKDKVYFADKIAKVKLQSVSGVGVIEMPGLREREIRVWIDPVRLRSRGLVVQDLANAIATKHVELPAGSLTIDRFKMDLRLQGEYSSVEELKSLPITTRDGIVIRLGDVADVEDGFEEEESRAYHDDEQSIMIAVKKQRGANEVAVCDAVTARFEEMQSILPEGIEMEVVYRKADFIRRSMRGVGGDVTQAVVLCSLLMLFFLQTIRATFVTVISMPVCLIGSLILMKGMGVTINNLSMMGISLAVGMVVDATTVVLENIDRHMRLGLSPREAASVGTQEVGFSVLGGALTTMAVFTPIAFMGGIIGRFFFAFGVTVVVTIGLSLVLSLTLTPFLCANLLQISEPGRAARFCDAILSSWERAYSRTLKLAVMHRLTTILIALGIFAGGVFIASKVGTA
ncbi:MAG: efflux RND transporter permease subunit, partial [Pyramidobacter sp.]|nr:efflux RND transporter permease subunit [Pyramidobacter sp.]